MLNLQGRGGTIIIIIIIITGIAGNGVQCMSPISSPNSSLQLSNYSIQFNSSAVVHPSSLRDAEQTDVPDYNPSLYITSPISSLQLSNYFIIINLASNSKKATLVPHSLCVVVFSLFV